MFELDVTVGLVRGLNNTIYGRRCDDVFALYCPHCRMHYTADLARYHSPSDEEEFACSECDGPIMFVSKPPGHLPVTQRARRYQVV